MTRACLSLSLSGSSSWLARTISSLLIPYFLAIVQIDSPRVTRWTTPDMEGNLSVCPILSLFGLDRELDHIMVSMLTEYLSAITDKLSPSATLCSIMRIPLLDVKLLRSEATAPTAFLAGMH